MFVLFTITSEGKSTLNVSLLHYKRLDVALNERDSLNKWFDETNQDGVWLVGLMSEIEYKGV